MNGCAFAALLAALSLGAREPLTLPEALRLAERASFQADAARLGLAAAREDTAQARALFRPEMTVSGGHVNLDHTPRLLSPAMELGPFPVLGAIKVPSMAMGVADPSSWRYKVGIQYLLYDFGRRDKAFAAARAREDAAEASGREGVHRLQAEVAARYMSLLNARAQKRVLAQRRSALQDHLRTVQDLFAQGIVARNDLLRTEVALRSVQDADGALDAACESAREGLNMALGLEPGGDLPLPEALDAPPALPWDEAALRTRAAAGNAAVQALQAKVRALDGQTALRKADFLPTVVAEAAHTYEQNSFMEHPHGTQLAVGLSWKVFDGGARRARVDQSATEAQKARRELLEARRGAETLAMAALREFRQALAEVGTARANVASAQENLRIVEDQYREGLARSTDALDAEAVLAESRSALLQRHYRAYAQQAALLASLGEDLAAFYERHLEK